MQFLLDHEYVFTLFYALIIFLFFVPRRKYFYIPFTIGFLLTEVYWHFRPLPGPVDFLVVYTLMIGILIATFKVDIFKILFALTTTFCVQHIAYKATSAICILINPNLRGEAIYLILMITFISLINLTIYYLFIKKMKNRSEIVINNFYLFFIAIFMLVANILLSYYVETPLLEEENYLICALVNLYAIATSFAGIFILFMSSKETALENENKILEIMLKNDQKRYEIAKITQEQINIKYHDLKHYMNENKLPKDEVIEIEEEGKLFKTIHYTGNKALDTVLFEKSVYCLKKNIQFLSICDGKLLKNMKSHHIYSMFANLIDNAIESELKIPEVNKRLIRLSVAKQRNSVVVSIENACFEEPEFVDGLPKTSKVDVSNHGFGTKSIKNIVNKYKGYIDFSWKNDVFFVKIVFPIN